MATKNDEAWEHYIKAKNISFDQASYFIEARELKRITGREPRLLATFGTPNQLPAPLKEAGYTLLPVKNGVYQLIAGNLFVKVPDCLDKSDFRPATSFPLGTAGRGHSESQYIDQAFNDGLLHHFLNIEKMYLTLRGRERTRYFEFQMSGITIKVESVQIEVDAGYEALRDIVLIEAKIGKPDYFNVRQIYYPYRHFSILVPQKSIRTVFLTYDIPSATYYLYEYTFTDPRDLLSIDLRKCGVFRVAEHIHPAIHDLIDAEFQSQNDLAPQADELNKVFELLSLVDAGINRADAVADYFIFDERQSNYYREASEYLGLLTSQNGDWELTDNGIRILSSLPAEQPLMFAKAVVNSWIFIELVEQTGSDQVITDTDIERIIRSIQTPDGSQRYTSSTVPRRRQTITAWIKWLSQEIGCFEIVDGGYVLR